MKKVYTYLDDPKWKDYNIKDPGEYEVIHYQEQVMLGKTISKDYITYTLVVSDIKYHDHGNGD